MQKLYQTHKKFICTIIFVLLGFQTLISQTVQQSAPWYHTAVIYQIYPRSFYDTNGDGIGDIQGIIDKLNYIKNTGFTAIWISPFFQSPQQDHGYDVSNYYNIDPFFGDSALVSLLIQEIHKRGMYVIFDMVLNHTSNEHEWFIESSSSKTNPKADWYIWHDGKKNGPPNNWKSTIGGSAWHYVAARDQYYYAAFLPFQPDLNYHNPQVKEAMFNTVRYWLKQGVDGFRLDLFNTVMEDEKLTNNPFSTTLVFNEDEGFFQKMEYTLNHPANYIFAEELRAVLDEFNKPERFLLGEVFGDNLAIKEYLGDGNNRLHLAFLFDMLNFNFDANYFREKVIEREKVFQYPYMPVYAFSNHDRKRSISRMGNNPEKAKLLATFQLTVRGVPVIYQGEEIGMTQAKIPLDKAQDPLAIKYSWMPQWLVNFSPESINRDECRTPMQWDSTINAGFTDKNATPWLPINSDYKQINVAIEMTDSQSVWHNFNKLLSLRIKHQALQSGNLDIIEIEPKNKIFAYTRSNDNERLLVLLNFSKREQQINLNDHTLNPLSISALYKSSPKSIVNIESIELAPYSSLILLLD